MHVLRHFTSGFKQYSFLDRGSDERQYCSPSVDLPVCSMMRTKYGEFPEYHTSLDNLNFVTSEGLQGGYEVLRTYLEALELNAVYKNTVLCEPNMGKCDLYPTLSTAGSAAIAEKHLSRSLLDFLAHADGTQSLLDISKVLGIPISE